MKRRLVSLILLILMASLFCEPVFVYSETSQNGSSSAEIDELNKKIAENREKVKQLEQSIETYKKKADQVKLESQSLANQIAILDNHVAQVELDIEVTENKLEVLNLEIETLDIGIKEKEKNISKQQKIIAELIRSIRDNEDKSYLEVFAAYDTFSDFYNRVQYLKSIEEDIGRNARALKIAREELQTKKQQKEEIKSAYENMKKDLVQKKMDLEEQTVMKGDLLAKTQSSELKFKTLISTLRGQYQQIENEIAGIEQEVRKKLDEQQRISETPEDANNLLSWPTQSRYLTSRFHDPDYPYRYIFEHNAIDVRASQGTAIRAAASGYVARAKRCSNASCYSFIMLIHSGGISTVYGHMSQILVKEDQFIVRGDVIGISGGTPGTAGSGPFVTGPHLHFEVRKDGIPVNPLSYLINDY